MICSHFSIFETLETTLATKKDRQISLWFALILVSLKHWKQRIVQNSKNKGVVICSHFSIFETLETTLATKKDRQISLWFALILVSLKHWKQRNSYQNRSWEVVICSHFSIFETLETTSESCVLAYLGLWFALILVSLKHWKQPSINNNHPTLVVICSHFSIFETLETTFIRHTYIFHSCDLLSF